MIRTRERLAREQRAARERNARRLAGAKPHVSRGRSREAEQRDVTADGLAWYMLDDDGFVLPKFREHVARLRKRPELSDIVEVVMAATSRRDSED